MVSAGRSLTGRWLEWRSEMIRLWPYVGWSLRNLWASTSGSESWTRGKLPLDRRRDGVRPTLGRGRRAGRGATAAGPACLCGRMVGIGARPLRTRDEHLHEVASLRIVLAGQVMRRRAGGLACENVAVNLEAQKLQPVDLARAVLACPVAFCRPMRFVCASCPPVGLLHSFC